MPKVAVRVFWQSDDGDQCRLRSTDLGWQVELISRNAAVIKSERVKSSRHAERIARDWKRQGGAEKR